MAAAEKPKTLKDIWSEHKPDFYRDVYANQMELLLAHLNSERLRQLAARRKGRLGGGENARPAAVSITMTAEEVLDLLGLKAEQWEVVADMLHGLSECSPAEVPEEVSRARCFHPLSLVSAPKDFGSGSDPVQFMGAALDPAAGEETPPD